MEQLAEVMPGLEPKYGLLPATGALLLRLLRVTKTNQTRTTDHIIAYKTVRS